MLHTLVVHMEDGDLDVTVCSSAEAAFGEAEHWIGALHLRGELTVLKRQELLERGRTRVDFIEFELFRQKEPV